MVAPAPQETRKGFRRNKRHCHVCRAAIPSGMEATKIVRADGVAGGVVRTLFWFCERHSQLFLDVLAWKGE